MRVPASAAASELLRFSVARSRLLSVTSELETQGLVEEVGGKPNKILLFKMCPLADEDG